MLNYFRRGTPRGCPPVGGRIGPGWAGTRPAPTSRLSGWLLIGGRRHVSGFFPPENLDAFVRGFLRNPATGGTAAEKLRDIRAVERKAQ